MTYWCVQLILFAEQPVWRALGGNFRGDRARMDLTKTLSILLFLATLGFSIWILSRLLAQSDKPRKCNNPRALFRSLCQTHALNQVERNLLRQIASHHNLTLQAEVFVRPECFQTDRLHAALSPKKSQVEALRAKLFGDE